MLRHESAATKLPIGDDLILRVDEWFWPKDGHVRSSCLALAPVGGGLMLPYRWTVYP